MPTGIVYVGLRRLALLNLSFYETVKSYIYLNSLKKKGRALSSNYMSLMICLNFLERTGEA